jgi:hypothetical protein
VKEGTMIVRLSDGSTVEFRQPTLEEVKAFVEARKRDGDAAAIGWLMGRTVIRGAARIRKTSVALRRATQDWRDLAKGLAAAAEEAKSSLGTRGQKGS